MNIYLKHGLILALIQFVIYMMIYFIDKSLLMNSNYMWFSYFFSLIYVVYAMLSVRNKTDKLFEFGERFKLVFFVLLISSYVTFATQMTLIHLDPEIKQLFEDYQLTISAKMAGFFQPKINKYELEELKLDAADQMKIMGSDSGGATVMISGIFNVTLMVLLLSMFYALFVGKEKMSFKERLKRLNI